ncbi:MAG: phenylacetic acid degradation protein PaaN [Candidatus Dormibacteria bacterium]
MIDLDRPARSAVDPAGSLRLFTEHEGTLSAALDAIRTRGYWSAYPEFPGAYDEEAPIRGKADFDAYLDKPFPLTQTATDGQVGGERSPYGFDLGTTYPRARTDELIAKMNEAIPAWRDAGADARAGVCLEILKRLNLRSHEIAHAVMHTTGQAFPMAFQAGGPHAQDRALEAIAYAYQEMTGHVPDALWEKPQGKRPPLRMAKRFRVVPRGVGLVIGCSTFPTWNGYPGLFASLVTGNAVLVKPSHKAILPLAITVLVAREVLRDAGFAEDLVALAVASEGEQIAQQLATNPSVRIIDYTGSTAFGEWLERTAHQARVYTEKAGVNVVVIDSTDDYKGMLANLAFTLSLYSGQMCTTTQNLFVPRTGIETDQGHKTCDAVAEDLGAAVDALLADPARAVALLGAISSPEITACVERAQAHGRLVRASRPLDHPDFPDATVRTPALVAIDGSSGEAIHLSDQFGPVCFVVATASTEESLASWARILDRTGSITAGVYTTRPEVQAAAEEVAARGGVALSFNLTGGVYVNQSAAFSDFHATGLNRAANASLCDAAFASGRFHVVQSRWPAPTAEPV